MLDRNLSHHHRRTLEKILEHPISHNIEWSEVQSLLEAITTVERHRDGKIAVTLGSEMEILEPPAGKDIDAQQVVDLRRMLTNAGYGSPSGEPAQQG